MAKTYPLWMAMPQGFAKEFCEGKDEFLSAFQRVLALFDSDEEAWQGWARERKEPSERKLLMEARYFARAEPYRMAEMEPGELGGCPAIDMVMVRVELARDLIPLVRRAGIRVEEGIYHSLGGDSEGGDEATSPRADAFPTEKLPNVVRFFFYMYRSGRLPV